jgi:transposase
MLGFRVNPIPILGKVGQIMAKQATKTLSELNQQIQEMLLRLEHLERENAELRQRNQTLESENQKLKELLHEKGAAKGSKVPAFQENYSVAKQTGQSQRGRKSTGRRSQDSKLSWVNQEVDVYPTDVERDECIEQGQQYAWRLVDGRAWYICYHLYGLPGSDELPSISGLRNRRSEYGIEVILTVAFLHYWIGISLDHVCDVMRFFTGLSLSKSQANSLLNQLSADWADKYDTIAELLARQLVVYVDETGWQVGTQACYTWAFSTAMHVLFRCGVSRSKAEAQAVLGETFAGVGVTDDYAAYKNLFNEHQLCWAHLLRKAIKLMLQHPTESQYREFFHKLYGLYQQAVRWQKDQRLSRGRTQKVEILQRRLRHLCVRANEVIDAETMSIPEQTWIRLQQELIKGIDCLFVFVAQPQVEPTNNPSERNVRREAEIRKGGRTSKTEAGAKRRSIIMTVLATLDTRFEQFTLENLLTELTRWAEMGFSVFHAELGNLPQAQPPPLTAPAT